MNIGDKINFAITVTIILAIGLVSGYAMGHFQAVSKSFPEIKMVNDTNPGIATITLMKVENGLLKGKVLGQKARLIWNSEAIVDLQPESDFKIPLKDIRLHEYYAASTLPQGAQFIASSKGKYYYSVFDKRALNLSQNNRVYFKTSEEAEKRGYLLAE